MNTLTDYEYRTHLQCLTIFTDQTKDPLGMDPSFFCLQRVIFSLKDRKIGKLERFLKSLKELVQACFSSDVNLKSPLIILNFLVKNNNIK